MSTLVLITYKGCIANPPVLCNTGGHGYIRCQMLEQERQFHLLRKGFDTLDVAFQGTLKSGACSKLKEAKELAQEQDVEMILVDMFGEKIEVGRRGARGGYAFQFSDELGNWFIKDKADVLDFSAFVSVGSEAFAKYTTWAEIETRIRYKLTMLFKGEVLDSVNRVDYCIDILPKEEGFYFDPDLFTVKNFKGADVNEKGYIREYGDAHDLLAGYLKDGEFSETEYYRMSNKITGQRWGKMPNRQLNIYNKTIEARVRRKLYWFTEWQKSYPELDARTHEVLRIESRGGKDLLKKYFPSSEDRTLRNVFQKIGAILYEAVELVSYRIQSGDSNKSRWDIHPLWLEVQQVFKEFDECDFDPANAGRVQRSISTVLLTGIEKQVRGTLCTSAVLNGCEDMEDLEMYLQTISSEVLQADADFDKSYNKVQGKYNLDNMKEVAREFREFVDVETGEVKRLVSG